MLLRLNQVPALMSLSHPLRGAAALQDNLLKPQKQTPRRRQLVRMMETRRKMKAARHDGAAVLAATAKLALDGSTSVLSVSV